MNKHKIQLKLLVVIPLFFTLISSNAPGAQNPSTPSKNFGDELSGATKGVLSDFLKQPKTFVDSARMIVPRDMSSDFQIGASAALPSGGGFSGKIDVPSLGISSGPILGCGGLNPVASIKNTFSKDMARNTVLRTLEFIKGTATTIITSGALFALANVCAVCYEVLTHNLGMAMDGFTGLEVPSCQQLQGAIDADVKAAMEKEDYVGAGLDGDNYRKALVGGFAGRARGGLSWTAIGKSDTLLANESWDGSKYTNKEVEAEQKKGIPAVDEKGAPVKLGGAGQPAYLGAADLAHRGVSGLNQSNPPEAGAPGPTDAHIATDATRPEDFKKPVKPSRIAALLRTLIGDMVLTYEKSCATIPALTTMGLGGAGAVGGAIGGAIVDSVYEKCFPSGITTTPPDGGPQKIYDNILTKVSSVINEIIKNLVDTGKMASDDDLRKIAAIAGIGVPGNKPALDCLRKGVQTNDPDAIIDLGAFESAVAKYRLIVTISTLYDVMNVATQTSASSEEDNAASKNFAAAGLARIANLFGNNWLNLLEMRQKAELEARQAFAACVKREDKKIRGVVG